MGLRNAPVLVSFEASVVAGARAARGPWSRRLESFAQSALRDGALVPSPHQSNLVRPDEVRDALQRVADALRAGRQPISFLLPDGIARIVLLDDPGGVRPEEYARYRLAGGLPFPVGEAVVQAQRVGGGRILAAIAWKVVIAEYEETVRAVGLIQERIDLAPLCAIAALRRDRQRTAGALLVLGEAAYSLAWHERDELQLFRNRRRDRDVDEPRRLALEVDRAARLRGHDGRTSVRVVGPGAPVVVSELTASGCEAEAGWRMTGGGLPVDAAELAWLGGLFA